MHSSQYIHQESPWPHQELQIESSHVWTNINEIIYLRTYILKLPDVLPSRPLGLMLLSSVQHSEGWRTYGHFQDVILQGRDSQPFNPITGHCGDVWDLEGIREEISCGEFPRSICCIDSTDWTIVYHQTGHWWEGPCICRRLDSPTGYFFHGNHHPIFQGRPTPLIHPWLFQVCWRLFYQSSSCWFIRTGLPLHMMANT